MEEDTNGCGKFIKDFYFKFKKFYGKEFQMDEFNAQVLELLIWYFIDDPRFEEAGYDLKKGILLIGDTGCGKSSMMNALWANPKQEFVSIPARLIVRNFNEGGMERVWELIKNAPRKIYERSMSYDKTYGICIEDVGTERLGRFYKDYTNVIEEVLQDCYEKFQLKYLDPYYTHMTMNLSDPVALEKHYGVRFMSRMKEMFNQIIFPQGPDRREGK